ncbi:MAG: hypothetical protein ACI8UO_002189 [Verrucomicrobiales bacterium]|jgi:hypothetical protein
MKIQTAIKATWVAFAVSGLLFIWQLVAYLTDNIPDHILPLVKILSGTQESVPVAYSWTIKIGALSVIGLFMTTIFIICAKLEIRSKQKN